MEAKVVGISSDNVTGKFRPMGVTLEFVPKTLEDSIVLQFIHDSIENTRFHIDGYSWTLKKGLTLK